MTTELEAGHLIAGTYEVVRKLGSGGMGTVYLARHRLLDAPRAVKVIRPDVASDSEVRRRFLKEAETHLFLVGARYVVPIHDLLVDASGELMLVMEYVSGRGVDKIWEASPGRRLAPTLARKIGAHVAKALAEAHSRGVVHRDVKPSNIMARDENEDVFLLADFGIAVLAERGDQTRVCGTPHYAAPEQLSGSPCPASDIYALGATLFQLASGKPPFLGAVAEIVCKHLHVAPPPLETSDDGSSDSDLLRGIVSRMLSKKPSERPNCHDVAATLGGGNATKVIAPPTPEARFWVALAGSHNLDRGPAAAAAEELGAAMVRAGIGVNTGQKCLGAEFLASRGVVRELGGNDPEGRFLRHYLGPSWPDAKAFGKVIRAGNNYYDQRVRDAKCLVVVAGGPGTEDMCERARHEGRPVVPLAATGGAAEALWRRIGHNVIDCYEGRVAPAQFRRLADRGLSPRDLAEVAAHITTGLLRW